MISDILSPSSPPKTDDKVRSENLINTREIKVEIKLI